MDVPECYQPEVEREEVPRRDSGVTRISNIVRFLAGADGWPEREGPVSKDQLVAAFRRSESAPDLEPSPDLADAELLLWPPDVFGIAAALLRHSAGYLSLANHWPPGAYDLFELFEGFGNRGKVVRRILAESNSIGKLRVGEPDIKLRRRTLEEVGEAYDHWAALSVNPMESRDPLPSPVSAQSLHDFYSYSTLFVGREWRNACQRACLETIGDLSNPERLLAASKQHPYHEPWEAAAELPMQTVYWWNVLRTHQAVGVSDIGRMERPPLREGDGEELRRTQERNVLIARVLICLMAVCDEACLGMGVRVSWHETSDDRPTSGGQLPPAGNPFDPLLVQAAGKLIARTLARPDERNGDLPKGLPATLCRRVMSRRAVVLPKMRTPQSGMTIRSLSHHLCHIRGNEAWAKWNLLTTPQQTAGYEDCLNLLLIPWPPAVYPTQFKRTTADEGATQEGRTLSQEQYGLFEYAPDGVFEEQLEAHVFDLLSNARKRCGHIDGIVFPELACSHETLAHLAWKILNADLLDYGEDWTGEDGRPVESPVKPPGPLHLIIGGVLQQGPGTEPHVPGAPGYMPENAASVYLRFPTNPKTKQGEHGPFGWYRQQQPKHHRWHIDGRQVVQYSLGASFDPERTWVEAINLPRRSLHFWMLAQKLNLAVLVCEDLAQADPIGDVVRAVAPNLVIALLADGPQLGNRWPARYASGLADDPGSSVLTLTSRGMSKLSSPGAGEDRSEVIAHWRDQQQGSREIAIGDEYDGAVLSLHLLRGEERTADGRRDARSGQKATRVTFGGLYPIAASSDKVKKAPRTRLERTLTEQSERLIIDHLLPLTPREVAFEELNLLVKRIQEEGNQTQPAERIREFVEWLKGADRD